MHQVYLLLRNNQQTGPYNIDELLQCDLKPFDLVWVEGRSAAWQYPGEIAALQAYVPQTPQPESPYMPVATETMERTVPAQTQPQPEARHVFVSMPRRVQPVRPAEKTFVPQEPPQPKPVEQPETKYARSLEDVESDYTNWVYRQKTKKKVALSPKDMIIAALVLAVIVAGYFLLSKPAMIRPAVNNTPPIAAQPAAASVTPPVQEPESGSSQAATPQVYTNTAPAHVDAQPKKNAAAKTQARVPASANANTSAPSAVPVSGPAQQPEAHTDAVPTTSQQPEAGQPQKKKLRDVLKGWFKKDKKPAAAAPASAPQQQPAAKTDDTPRPAANRQAARRGDEAAASAPAEEESHASLADQLDISSNAPDNWMMGVSGLKVTLRNRSNTAVQSAAVDVLYYDQNNRLMERKTIYFNSIPAKGKQTQSAPDQKWADHVDFKLGNITAKDDRFAKG